MAIATPRARVSTYADVAPELMDQGWRIGYPTDLSPHELDKLYDGPSSIPCPVCGGDAETIWLHRERRGIFGGRQEAKAVAVCGGLLCGAATELG